MMFKKLAVATATTACLLSASVSAQLTEARIPVRVNAAATVSIQPPHGAAGTGAAKTVSANVWDTLNIMIDAGTISVSHGARRHNAVHASARYSRGNISVELHPQQYRNATVSLYSVSGKRVLSGRAAASAGTSNFSRHNAAPGVYILSVRGDDGNSYSTRLTHSGGRLNITATFGGSDVHSLNKNASPSSAGEWTLTASAPGYVTQDSTFVPVSGLNPAREIALAQTPTIVGTFTDARDGKTYRMVTIGAQTWMAENLNYVTNNSSCYVDADSNCVKYGRLYPLSDAMTACPAGWHLPSGGERGWGGLINYVNTLTSSGFDNNAGTKLKSTSGWRINGTDEYNFSALPGGVRRNITGYGYAGEEGYWWSSHMFNAEEAAIYFMASNSNSADVMIFLVETALASVRCVMNDVTDKGSCTVGGVCSDNVTRSSCSGTFVSGGNCAISPPQDETFTDERDGKVYKTVTIGTQTWMAENLNYQTSGSTCHPANCDTYGRWYTWASAMGGALSSNSTPSGVQGVCPAGWHLPSDAEWTTLVNYAGGSSTVGTMLRSRSGWSNNGNGTDRYGFSALPGGLYSSSGVSFNVGYGAYWWSATEVNASNAWHRGVYGNYASVDRDSWAKNNEMTVRCVRD